MEAVKCCVEVAVPLPVTGLFTYAVPDSLVAKIRVGVRVLIPFKNREMIGYLIDQKPFEGNPAKLKPLTDILDDQPVLSPAILELTRWMSRYYGASWGEAIENALPRWVKYGKRAQRALTKDESVRYKINTPLKDFELTKDQAKALEIIRARLAEAAGTVRKPILLYGVTGSGKSEVYIRAIREVLQKSQSAICLVPEIALTEQLRHFFLEHFGDELEILHSKLTDTERFLAWKRLEARQRRVVLGPRSAVFAPLPNLGLIIMDEEHEGTYKQETNPRYHAREVAQWRARHENALLVMGTATPSLETMYRTETGEVERIDLTARIDAKAMPEVKIIDLKDAPQIGGFKSVILTPPLATAIDANLKKKESTLLLLNRRGFSTSIHCPKCGNVETCDSCQVSLTFHQEDDTLLCHYCNCQKAVPTACANCGTNLLRFAGFGTEKVESEVARRFPQARLARMDADSVRKRGSHEIILKEFRERKIDILIGTQMIAKGFDFPHVTLVGVILADVGLTLPNFRSGERTFQLLTQVAGRAGRGKIPGRVIIQTYSPQHPSVLFAKNHDFLSFYDEEKKAREEHHYPPYSQLINVIIRSRDEKKAYQFGRELRELLNLRLREGLENSALEFSPEMIGPAPLPFYKLRGHFRWHVMIKSPRCLTLAGHVIDLIATLKKPSSVALAVDVDPLNIL